MKKIAVARFRKRPEIDLSGRLRMAKCPGRGPACARLCSGKLACTFSLRTNASLSVPSLHFLASIFSQSFLVPRSSRSTPDRHAGVLNDRWRKPSSSVAPRSKRSTAGNGNWHKDLKTNLQMLQRVDAETHGTSHLPFRCSFWRTNLSELVRFRGLAP